MRRTPELDVTAVIVSHDDEDQVGHAVRRVADHLRELEQRFEILVVDEGSCDNTLPLLAMLKPRVPGLDVLAGAAPGRGLVRGASVARGRAVVLLDARVPAPLPALSFALARLDHGADAVALASRGLVVRRARTWNLFDSLVHRRDFAELEARFVRRARAAGLHVRVEGRRPPTAWDRVRGLLRVPLLSRAG